jgi:hypothetical protein
LPKTALKRFPVEDVSEATPEKTRKLETENVKTQVDENVKTQVDEKVKTQDDETVKTEDEEADIFFDVSDNNPKSQSLVGMCDNSVMILEDESSVRLVTESQEVIDLSTENVVKEKVDESPSSKSPSLLKKKKSVSDLSDEKSGEDTDSNLKRR